MELLPLGLGKLSEELQGVGVDRLLRPGLRSPSLRREPDHVRTPVVGVSLALDEAGLLEIERNLGASLTDLQWVVDSYVLALAALTLMAGSLADRLGRKLVFTTGLAAFHGGLAARGLRR
jgi:hypothetical protein